MCSKSITKLIMKALLHYIYSVMFSNICFGILEVATIKYFKLKIDFM